MDKFLSSIINIVIGFIIGYIVGRMVFNSVITVGPASKDIKSYTYKDKDGICYKLVPKVHICPISISMNKMPRPLP